MESETAVPRTVSPQSPSPDFMLHEHTPFSLVLLWGGRKWEKVETGADLFILLDISCIQFP